MTDQQLQPIDVLPAKHFFHEAAHALALYSLGVTPVSMSVTTADDRRMTHGSVMPPETENLLLWEHAFFKMSGPAAHIYLGNSDFETDRNMFVSDFTSILRNFPSLATNRDQAAQTLMVCKRFLEEDCRNWVERQHSSISGLALALESSLAGENRYELKGQALQNALDLHVDISTIQASKYRTQLEKSFLALSGSMPRFNPLTAPDWVKFYWANAKSSIPMP
jgi:hypothetical protein